jgi:hypothetical protein
MVAQIGSHRLWGENPIIWLPNQFGRDSLFSIHMGGDREPQSALAVRRAMGEDRTTAAD